MILFRLRERKAYILSIKKELKKKQELIADGYSPSTNLREIFAMFNTERSSLIAKDNEYINIISCRAINKKHKKSETKIEDTLSHIPTLEKAVSNIICIITNIEEAKKFMFLESKKEVVSDHKVVFNHTCKEFIGYLKRNIPNWLACIDKANNSLDKVCNEFQNEICVHLKIKRRTYQNELHNID